MWLQREICRDSERKGVLVIYIIRISHALEMIHILFNASVKHVEVLLLFVIHF